MIHLFINNWFPYPKRIMGSNGLFAVFCVVTEGEGGLHGETGARLISVCFTRPLTSLFGQRGSRKLFCSDTGRKGCEMHKSRGRCELQLAFWWMTETKSGMAKTLWHFCSSKQMYGVHYYFTLPTREGSRLPVSAPELISFTINLPRKSLDFFLSLVFSRALRRLSL